ncbi:hypothetical protein GALMADRAFT_1052086 [Galerina marginata CBS 339.88]|uniref:Uncharacterized protein n=1 Tax=Galerina marginata (strain CBS 339.88) TaxID=685588 RepID=A0A067SMY4_GALM3|nr:hypothetical protein GALMADRAFT_1052086 [Galerina marginata CBS 339.88]
MLDAGWLVQHTVFEVVGLVCVLRGECVGVNRGVKYWFSHFRSLLFVPLLGPVCDVFVPLFFGTRLSFLFYGAPFVLLFSSLHFFYFMLLPSRYSN